MVIVFFKKTLVFYRHHPGGAGCIRFRDLHFLATEISHPDHRIFIAFFITGLALDTSRLSEQLLQLKAPLAAMISSLGFIRCFHGFWPVSCYRWNTSSASVSSPPPR